MHSNTKKSHQEVQHPENQNQTQIQIYSQHKNQIQDQIQTQIHIQCIRNDKYANHIKMDVSYHEEKKGST